MKITRRSFIRASGALAVSGVLFSSLGQVFGQKGAGGEGFPIPIESTTDPLNYLTRSHFEPFVNAYLQIQSGKSRPTRLQLLEVRELSKPINQKRGINGESFSLLFRSDQKRSIEGQVYTFRHASLGTFSLFLSPVGMSGHEYEAIVNRISQ